MSEGLPQAANNAEEPHILSFILRVWREETDVKETGKVWRGHITLIPDGERQYFSDINQIPALIASHLNRNP